MWEREEEWSQELALALQKAGTTRLERIASLAVEDERTCYKHVVALLHKQHRKSGANARSKLHLLYCVSSLLRLSRRHFGVRDRYVERLTPLTAALVGELRGEFSSQVDKLLKLWRQEGVFVGEQLADVEAGRAGSLQLRGLGQSKSPSGSLTEASAQDPQLGLGDASGSGRSSAIHSSYPPGRFGSGRAQPTAPGGPAQPYAQPQPHGEGQDPFSADSNPNIARVAPPPPPPQHPHQHPAHGGPHPPPTHPGGPPGAAGLIPPGLLGPPGLMPPGPAAGGGGMYPPGGFMGPSGGPPGLMPQPPFMAGPMGPFPGPGMAGVMGPGGMAPMLPGGLPFPAGPMPPGLGMARPPLYPQPGMPPFGGPQGQGPRGGRFGSAAHGRAPPGLGPGPGGPGPGGGWHSSGGRHGMDGVSPPPPPPPRPPPGSPSARDGSSSKGSGSSATDSCAAPGDGGAPVAAAAAPPPAPAPQPAAAAAVPVAAAAANGQASATAGGGAAAAGPATSTSANGGPAAAAASAGATAAAGGGRVPRLGSRRSRWELEGEGQDATGEGGEGAAAAAAGAGDVAAAASGEEPQLKRPAVGTPSDGLHSTTSSTPAPPALPPPAAAQQQQSAEAQPQRQSHAPAPASAGEHAAPGLTAGPESGPGRALPQEHARGGQAGRTSGERSSSLGAAKPETHAATPARTASAPAGPTGEAVEALADNAGKPDAAAQGRGSEQGVLAAGQATAVVEGAGACSRAGANPLPAAETAAHSMDEDDGGSSSAEAAWHGAGHPDSTAPASPVRRLSSAMQPGPPIAELEQQPHDAQQVCQQQQQQQQQQGRNGAEGDAGLGRDGAVEQAAAAVPGPVAAAEAPKECAQSSTDLPTVANADAVTAEAAGQDAAVLEPQPARAAEPTAGATGGPGGAAAVRGTPAKEASAAATPSGASKQSPASASPRGSAPQAQSAPQPASNAAAEAGSGPQSAPLHGSRLALAYEDARVPVPLEDLELGDLDDTWL